QAEFGLSEEETKALFFHVMDHQDLIEGTEKIAHRLGKAGYRIFALTDNVHEIVAHLKARHRFWNVFEGAVVSAEVGMLKPAPAIFQHAIDRFCLRSEETAFFDDVEVNVDGARSIGLEARLFTTPGRCEADLQALGLSF